MDKRYITCCFSGHRPVKLPWGAREDDPACVKLRQEIESRIEGIYEAGYRHFICGMAIGCDMYFAEAVLALKQLHEDVTLEAAIPCATQPERWSRPLRERYNSLIDRCSSVKVLQLDYSPDCMMRRNKYMVDNADLLISVYDGSGGGTGHTVKYAESKNLRIMPLWL